MHLRKQFEQKIYKVLFSLFFIIISCSPKTAPKIAVPEATKTKIIQEIESYLKKNDRSLLAAKGYAKVKLKIKSKRESFDAVVIVDLTSVRSSVCHSEGETTEESSGSNWILRSAQDDTKRCQNIRFRFETLDDLGNTKYLIVSDGVTLSWRDLSKEEWETTPLSEKNLSKFLPLANSIEETLGLLIGRMPKIDLASTFVFPSPPTPLPKEEGGQTYRIEFSQGELIWNNKTKAIEFLALKNKNGKLTFEFHGKDFREWIVHPKKGMKVALPSEIKLIDLKTKNEIEINYNILEVGTDLSFSPTLFEIESE